MPTLPGFVALVDDDASLLRALTRVLVAHGYRVKTFTSAEQYLAEADAAHISCAVIDVHLGGPLSGLDLGDAITTSTPTVFMSGSWDAAMRQRAREIGCLGLLDKPFLTSALVATLEGIESHGADRGA